MTTKSLQVRQARQAQAAQRRGGGFGKIVAAAALALAAPGLAGLIWQAPSVPVAAPPLPTVAPRLPAGPAIGGQDDAAAKPAAEPAPLRTAMQGSPMPPRPPTPWRRRVIAPASAGPTVVAGDAVGPLDFPPRLSSRNMSAEWFGARTVLPEPAPAPATRRAPATLPDLPATTDLAYAPILARAPDAAPRDVTAAVITAGGPAPRPPSAQGRDITAALFPGGQLRPWVPATVAPASPQARDITRRLFPSGEARW